MQLEPLALVSGLGRYPRPARFSPDGSRCLLADDSGRVAIASSDGEILVETRLKQVIFTAWSPDDRYVATCGDGMVRIHRASDLSIVNEREICNGEIAFCMGGQRLVHDGPSRHLGVLEVPSLAQCGSYQLADYTYQCFDVTDIVADGTFLAVSDNGGYSEDEIGNSAGHGAPSTTVLNAETVSRIDTIEYSNPTWELALDRWRKRLLVVGMKQFVAYDFELKQIAAAPAFKRAAISERWLATWNEGTVDFVDPVTYASHSTSGLKLRDIRWMSASPDGSRLLVPESPDGVRFYRVSGK